MNIPSSTPLYIHKISKTIYAVSLSKDDEEAQCSIKRVFLMETHDTMNLFYLSKFYATTHVLPSYKKATILGKVSPKCTYLS